MLEKIKGGLLVACLALEGEPLHSSFIMGRMALAASQGGAVGIRASGKEDIAEINRTVDLPVIGIVKKFYPGFDVFDTPTRNDIDELLTVHCDMIGMDATPRPRPSHETVKELVDYIHQNGRLALADCSTLEECLRAEQDGFDMVATTLCGYTDYSVNLEGPDFDLIQKAVDQVRIPVIAEGKINTPEDLTKAFEAGAYCAVVGSAITRPQVLTKRFVNAIKP